MNKPIINNLFKDTKKDGFNEDSCESYGFQDANLRKAVLMLKKAIKENYRIDLGFTSNCITSGCRKIIIKLCQDKVIDSIVTTAGGIEEDIIQQLDGEFKNIEGPFDDKKLFEKGYFRSGNRIARSTGYCKLQTHLEKKLDSYNESYVAVTSSSGTANFDCESGNTFSITLSESVATTNFQNPPASGTGYTMTIEVIQDSGGSGYLVAWPTSVDWPAATAPTLTATASGKDVFVFTTRDGGTTWYGFTAGQAIG